VATMVGAYLNPYNLEFAIVFVLSAVGLVGAILVFADASSRRNYLRRATNKAWELGYSKKYREALNSSDLRELWAVEKEYEQMRHRILVEERAKKIDAEYQHLLES
jgi:hypothetical protein